MKKFNITRYEVHEAYAEVTYLIEAETEKEALAELDILDSKNQTSKCIEDFMFDEFCDGPPLRVLDETTISEAD